MNVQQLVCFVHRLRIFYPPPITKLVVLPSVLLQRNHFAPIYGKSANRVGSLVCYLLAVLRRSVSAHLAVNLKQTRNSFILYSQSLPQD